MSYSCTVLFLVILSHLGVDLLAYWDRGNCGPDGDNSNWEWCDKRAGENCHPVVKTDKCSSHLATLIDVLGDQNANADHHLNNFHHLGCNYAYYARYKCTGNFF